MTPNPFKDDMTGKLLLGKYRIVRRLAAGGMGVVYLARTEGAEGFTKPVVLKLILPDFASNKEFVSMFVREAKILASLEDPGIVTVLDFALENNFYIMVLEYVHGFQLREWMRYFQIKKLGIPADILMQVFINVLDSLHHAHTSRGPDGRLTQIIHRDISPTNILITTDGRTKLVDFGIARMSSQSGNTEITRKGSFKGKFAYSAPERFSGATAGVPADIYSVAVTLHETLIGRNDFLAADEAGIISRVLTHTPKLVEPQRKDAPAGLDAVLQRAMSKSPGQRHASAAEFARDLRKLLPRSEYETSRRLTASTQKYFTDEMAETVGVETLSSRMNAWRNPSTMPPEEPAPGVQNVDEEATAPGRRKKTAATLDDVTAASVQSPKRNESPPVVTDQRDSAPQPESKLEIVSLVTEPVTDGTERVSHRQQDIPRVAPGSDEKPLAQSSKIIRVLLLMGVLIILGLGMLIGIVLTRPTAAPKRNFMLVQNPSRAVAEETITTDSGAPAADSDVALPDKKGKPIQTVVRAKKPQSQAVLLTEAFRKHNGKIQGCIEENKSDLSGVPRISIKLSIDEAGKVTDSSVAPAAVNQSAVGTCLNNVTRSARFPAQDAPVTFAIPVEVSNR